MKLFNWILGRKDYLNWDEYEKIKNAKEEEAWQKAKTPKFSISK